MKKYILLIILLCFASLHLRSEKDILQDSTRLFKGKLLPKVDMESLQNLNVDLPEIDFDMPDLSAIDTAMERLDKKMLALNERMNSKSFNVAKTARVRSLKSDNSISSEQVSKSPTRIENKVFTGISEIEIDHKYGNIIVRESNAKQVSLEIQYFDSGTSKASCNVSTSNNILFIVTTSSKRAKINYIISIPRNTKLAVIQKYGNIKFDDYRGAFSGDISYGNLDAQSFSSTKPFVKIKYGNVTIGTVPDLSIVASFSNVKINKSENIEASGNYSNYVLDNVQTLSLGNSISYGDFKIGTIGSVKANLKYTDLSIDNLLSDISGTCSYSDVRISSSSSKLNSIVLKGSYSDMTITLPADISASFSVNLTYGDFSVSRKHTVTYTEQTERNNRITKSGKIGSKIPKTQLELSNTYADIRIR